MMLAAHGLSVRVPTGWDVRIYRREPTDGEVPNPILHAATVRLPWSRGDYGSNVVDRLGADDAFVALLEFDRADASTALFAPRGLPHVTATDFGPRQLHRVLPHQSGTQSFFRVNGRPFSLYVVLGAHSRRLLLVDRVQQLLDGIGVGGRG